MTIYSTISKLLKANVLYALLGLSINVIIARELGPYLKGELALFLLLSSFLALSMRLGLDTSIIRFLKTKGGDFSLVINSIFFSLIIIFSFFFFLFIITNNLSSTSNFIKSHEYYYFIYLLIPIEVVGLLISSFLLGSNHISKYSRSIVIQPLSFLAVICTLLIFNFQLHVEIVITITVISYLIKLIYLLYLVRALSYRQIKFSLSKSFNLARFGMKSHIGNVMDFFIIRTDVLLISFFIGIEGVGIYSISMLAEKINILSNSIGSAVFAKIKTSKDSNLVNKIIRQTLPILLFIILVAIFFSNFVMSKLFGASFDAAVHPFIILLIGFAFLALSKPMKAYLVVIDKPFLLSKASAVSLFCNLIFNIILIPSYGLIGAAIATSFANIIYVLFILHHYKKFSLENYKSIFLITKTDLMDLIK